MGFDLDRWKAGVHRQLRKVRNEIPFFAANSAYGFLATMALIPVAEAAAQGNQAALLALANLAGGIGLNFWSDKIAKLRDSVNDPEAQAEVANLLAQQAAENAQVRHALDNIFSELQIMQQARQVLPAETSQRLQRQLVTEYKLIVQGDIKVQGDFVAPGATKVVHHHTTSVLPALPPSEVQPEVSALCEAYLSRLWHLAAYLPLEGVDKRARSTEAESQLALDAVYTALLTRSPKEEVRLMQGGVPYKPKLRYRSALQQLDQYHRLVLLGDPGSGKSTFVNFVALCLAGEAIGNQQTNLSLLTTPLPNKKGEREKERQPWRHGALLPVRVILRDFAAHGLPARGKPAGAGDLWRFIEAELEQCNLGDYAPHLRKTLLEQGGLLLLDGLDEVPEAQARRTQLKRVVEEFARSHPRCRILVTSRTYAYQRQEWRLSGFQVAELAPFTIGQIRCFVDRWYVHVAERRDMRAEQAKGRAQLLKRVIERRPNLREFAQRPLLLTLMASLHAWRGGSLPEKREELYANAVELLLDWWERQRVVVDAQGKVQLIQPSLSEWLNVDQAQVRSLLERLAYEAHYDQPEMVGTADIPEGKLLSGLLRLTEKKQANMTQLVAYLSERAGLLLPRGVGIYTFPHRTFQEYLAACYLTESADYPYNLADLVKEDPNRWREVALLAAAKAKRGTTASLWYLVDALCEHEPNENLISDDKLWGAQLAGQALVENGVGEHLRNRHQAKLTRVKQWLVHLIRSDNLPPTERAEAGRTLARLGDPRPEVLTVDQMQFCYVPAGPFWMGAPPNAQEARHNEGPLHKVDLPYDYWMSRYPVTNGQFEEFVQAGGYNTPEFWIEAKEHGYWKDGKMRGRVRPHDFGSPYNLLNHPVVGVTWYEVLAFTRWLTKKWAGQPPARLPTEAEWEKSARGGLRILREPLICAATQLNRPSFPALTANPLPQRHYPWGDQFEATRANSEESGIGVSNAVGIYKIGKSPYGCEEMSGNVYEWVQTLYKSYPYSPNDGREQLNLDQGRVLRGGSYSANSMRIRCFFRGGHHPYDGYNGGGVRVFRSYNI